MPPRLPKATPHNKPKLLDQLRHAFRVKHQSLGSERSYCDWIRRLILFNRVESPRWRGRHRQHARRMRYPDPHARTGTLAVRSSLPQLTHAPLIARRIAFQMQ
jgi:hypothetical protein